MQDLLFIFGGAGLGLAIGLLAPLRAPAEGLPRAVVVQAAAGASQPCTAARAEREAAVGDVTRALETAKALLSVQRVRREQREGVAQPWPDRVHPALRPEGWRAAVHAAAAQSGFEVAGIDCQEYPCLATVVKTEGLRFTDGTSSAYDARPFLEAMPTEIVEDGASVMMMAFVPEPVGPRYVATVGWYGPHDKPDDGARKRLNVRLMSLHKEHTE